MVSINIEERMRYVRKLGLQDFLQYCTESKSNYWVRPLYIFSIDSLKLYTVATAIIFTVGTPYKVNNVTWYL